MKKIAIFGKPGSGKSTLSKELASVTGLSLYPVDLIQYQRNGEKVPRPDYDKAHDDLLNTDYWIIEGLGYLDSFWRRIDTADTLIYIDLPYSVSYWWTSKRLLKSLFVRPQGWPEGSSVLKGTVAGWKNLYRSPRFWTAELFTEIQRRAKDKTVYRITTVTELRQLARQIGHVDTHP